MANMLTNRHDIEQSISDEMFDDAIKFGQLAGTRDAPLTASTYGQAAMQGRAIGGLLGGQDPRMAKQDLIDELMAKHQNPSTKKELLAVAEDAATLGLYDIQGQFLDIASKVPEPRKANKDEISVIASQLTLTQGSDMMLDNYLIDLNGQKAWDALDPAGQTAKRNAVQSQFNHIIKGYEAWLGTQNLKPEDVNKLMFTNEGELQNLTMFKRYISKLAGSNVFAKYLFEHNEMLIANSGDAPSPNDSSIIDDDDTVDIPDESILVESIVNEVVGELDANGEVITEARTYTNLSKNEKIIANNKVSADLIRKLSEIYSSMVTLGIFPDDKMGGEELRQEQQDDSHQAWIGGTMLGKFGFTPMMTKNGQAYKHFKSQPKERFEEYLLDPEAYYKKYIVLDEGVIREGTSQTVIELWGLN
jgi:hypothetical protein